MADLPGVTILGTMDDDETMVGTSPDAFPWTCYILADCPDRNTVKAACNMFRTIEVGGIPLVALHAHRSPNGPRAGYSGPLRPQESSGVVIAEFRFRDGSTAN